MSEQQPSRGQDTQARVRILLADDHDVVREGLRKLLEGQPHWVVCGEAVNGRQAVIMCQEMKPDIAVLDISMPELNGVDASKQILKVSPTTEILVFTMHESELLVRDMLAAGVRGYLLKSDPVHNVIEAVASLALHRPYFNTRTSETILAGYLNAMAKDTPSRRLRAGEPLTGREREILQLLAEGRSNKEIARRLAIGVKTVETHRSAIMRKIGAKSVVDIVRFAIRNHIVEF
jgi:DNA-binding NarL/FixJ family response regulator